MTLPTPLINRHRAESVMKEFGVGAIVLSEPMTIYHATGFWPQTLAMGHLGSSLAVVPSDATQPVALITGQFVHYFFDLDDDGETGPLRIYLYTAPDGSEGGAAAPVFFAAAQNGTPDSFEQASRASTTKLLETRPQAPTAMKALTDALADLNISGTLAVDGFLPESGLGPTFRYCPAEPILRRIRMIKSAAEITLMRHAARSNAEAAAEAIRSTRVGDTYGDLRRAFFAETGRRGGVPLFLLIDNAAYETRDGVIREGRSFQIDAVGHYAGYHGDYGRTVFVGTPSLAIRDAMNAAIAANEAMSRALRPGMRYSDLMRVGKQAAADAGYDVVIPAAPHSVGLFHTDEAFLHDALSFAKADHLIEKDMVLSMDCPVLQTDAGGTVHLEDLWLVTEEGCEPLNDRSNPFFQLGANP